MPKAERQSQRPTPIPTVAAAGGGGSGRNAVSWSAKDDEILISARAQGLNWNQIAPKHFKTKTPNACRKRHERLMERRNAEEWDGVKLETLAVAYMEVRKEMWSILADRVGEKWTLVEQKCMEKGIKNLQQAHRSALKKQGTYHEHDDSGVGFSDAEDDIVEGHHTTIAESSHNPYQGGYPLQRGPSIQSLLSVPPTYPSHS